MYRTILLAYDGTAPGREALRQGADIARQCAAQVILLAVIAPQSGALIGEAAAVSDALFAQARAEVERVLDDGLRGLRDLGLEARTCIRHGNAAEAIGRAAREFGADLIVVGHRDQSTLARWWGGSTGSSLLAHTPCSILIAVVGAAS